MGRGLGAFPYMTIYPQDEHERMLIGELESLGVVVERSVELLTVREGPTHVEAEVRDADGNARTLCARYVGGADGAHSAVRGTLDVGFPGGTYERVFYVADVEATGPVVNREHIALDTADFVGVFPMAGDQRARFIGSVLRSALRRDRPLGWDDVSGIALSSAANLSPWRRGAHSQSCGWAGDEHRNRRCGQPGVEAGKRDSTLRARIAAR